MPTSSGYPYFTVKCDGEFVTIDSERVDPITKWDSTFRDKHHGLIDQSVRGYVIVDSEVSDDDLVVLCFRNDQLVPFEMTFKQTGDRQVIDVDWTVIPNFGRYFWINDDIQLDIAS